MRSRLSLLGIALLVTGFAVWGGIAGAQQSAKKTVPTTKKAASAHDHDHAHDAPPLPTRAVCVLVPSKGSKTAGTLTLAQMQGHVQITGEITGLTPGKHGFHIHEFGDLTTDDGKAAGPHFNPHNHKHGGPDSSDSHAGDLGNVTADDSGTAKVNVRADVNLHFIVGRSLVVHADPDDLTSQPAGNAGARIAVGVIGIAAPPAASKSKN